LHSYTHKSSSIDATRYKKVKDKPLYERCNEVQRGLLSIKEGPGAFLKKGTKGVSVSDHSCSQLAEHQKWFTEKPWHRLTAEFLMATMQQKRKMM
jgi:hypothetical protein